LCRSFPGEKWRRPGDKPGSDGKLEQGFLHSHYPLMMHRVRNESSVIMQRNPLERTMKAARQCRTAKPWP